jgi:hypothetical protein
MAHDHDTAVAGSELGGEELQPAAVEMVCGLIEQQEVVVSAQKTGQAHAVALSD